MSEEIKIYHVETQEDYDDLMVELENEGYKWYGGEKPTHINCWTEPKDETVIYLNENKDYRISYGFIKTAEETYPDIPIIKHKQSDKVVVPKFVADWYEDFRYKSLRLVLNHLMNCRDQRIMEWVDKNSPRSAQEIIAKMHLFQDYEVEEKKYYWRKKKEYLFDFELLELSYLRIHRETKGLMFGAAAESNQYQVLLTETQVRQAVSEEDFNKLEKVENE